MRHTYKAIWAKAIFNNIGKCLFTLLILLCGFTTTINAQGYSNKGKDFWITYPAHIDGSSSAMGIYITSDVAASGTIFVGNKSTIKFTVSPNNVTRKFLGPNTAGDAPNGNVYLGQIDAITPNGAIHVVADNNIVVYAHIIKSHRSGASLILPSNVWGRQYIVPSYQNQNPSSGSSEYGFGTVTVVAKDSNTVIQITPKAKSRSTTRAAGVPYQITLVNPGDVYQVESVQDADISGTLVESISSGSGGCKPIAVFSSTTWSSFGCTSSASGDNLYQQLFPTGAWGKSFLTAPALGRKRDIFRIYVKDTTTTVQYMENGVTTVFPKLALTNKSFYEYETGNPIYIQADKPVSALQYFTTETCDGTIGDPEMVALNPIEQTVNNITVFSAHQNWVPAGQSSVDHCYLNIIINSAAARSFSINGAPPSGSFVSIPGTNYSYLQEDVTRISVMNPVQVLSADSNFTAIAYGFGDVESYGYNAGTNIKDFSQYLTIQNPYASPFNNNTTCSKNPFHAGIVLPYQPISIEWNFNSNTAIMPNATVTMNSPVADSIFVTNGNMQYYYKLPGTYIVNSNTSIPVKVTVNNPTSDGCSGLQVIDYTINLTNAPTSSFTIQSTGCLKDSVYFINNSTDNGTSIVQYNWNYNGTSTSTIYSPATQYNTTGNFTVTLRNINSLGCYADTTEIVSVSTIPQPLFTQVIPACKHKSVQFTDQSTIAAGTLSHWYWDYGNGNKDSLTKSSTVSQQYDTTVTDTVRLTVVSSSGCKASTYHLVTVHELPVAAFETPDICLNDAFAQFANNSTITDGTQNLLTYIWQFGDPNSSAAGNSSNTITGIHKYSAVGNYTVQLKAISNNGCADSINKSFMVNGSIPVANFSILNQGKLCSNDSVHIKNTSTVDFGNITLLQIYWDYTNNPGSFVADTMPAAGKVYRYEYYGFNQPLSKQFSIHFAAYSGLTCVSTKDTIITVYAAPEISFTIQPKNSICLGDAFTLQGIASGITATTVSNVLWNFGDRIKDTNWLTFKTYKDSGNYSISFTGTTINGCKDSALQKVVVYPVPSVHTQGQVNVLQGTSVTLTPTYIGNQLSYLWQPALYLNNASISNPICTPDTNALYTINVTNNHLCSAADTLLVRVLFMPIIPNVFSPNGDNKHDTWHIEMLNKYPNCSVDVFDRNGQPVFHSFPYDTEWDGTCNGQPVPIGVYYYVIKPGSGREPLTGSVTVIR